jgi:hypothetical protein
MAKRPEFQRGWDALVWYSGQDIEEVKGEMHVGS